MHPWPCFGRLTPSLVVGIHCIRYARRAYCSSRGPEQTSTATLLRRCGDGGDPGKGRSGCGTGVGSDYSTWSLASGLVAVASSLGFYCYSDSRFAFSDQQAAAKDFRESQCSDPPESIPGGGKGKKPIFLFGGCISSFLVIPLKIPPRVSVLGGQDRFIVLYYIGK
ncbi:hypothetical protein Dimus_034303 [Dionaea muscipula]